MPRKISFSSLASSPSSKNQHEHHHHHHAQEQSEGVRSQRSVSTSSSGTAVASNLSPATSPASSIISTKRRSGSISNSSHITVDSLAPPSASVKSSSTSPSKVKLLPGKVVKKVKSGIHRIGELFETHHHHHHHHYYSYPPGQEPVEGYDRAPVVKEENLLLEVSHPGTIAEESSQPGEKQRRPSTASDSPASIPLPLTPESTSPHLHVVPLPVHTPSPRRPRKLSKIRRISQHFEGSKGAHVPEFSIGSALVASSTATAAPVHPFFGVSPASGSTPRSMEKSAVSIPPVPDSPTPHSKARSKSRSMLFLDLPRQRSISGTGPRHETAHKELKSSKSNEELKAAAEKQKTGLSGLSMRVKGWRSKSITAASAPSFAARRRSSVSDSLSKDLEAPSASEFGEMQSQDVVDEVKEEEVAGESLITNPDDAVALVAEESEYDIIGARSGLLPIPEGAIEPEHPSPCPASPIEESEPAPSPLPADSTTAPIADSHVLVTPSVYVEPDLADPFLIHEGTEHHSIQEPDPAYLCPPSLSQNRDEVDSIADTSDSRMDNSDDDGSDAGITDVYIPGLIIPSMFYPSTPVRRSFLSNILTWWLSPPSSRASSRSSTMSSRW